MSEKRYSVQGGRGQVGEVDDLQEALDVAREAVADSAGWHFNSLSTWICDRDDESARPFHLRLAWGMVMVRRGGGTSLTLVCPTEGCPGTSWSSRPDSRSVYSGEIPAYCSECCEPGVLELAGVGADDIEDGAHSSGEGAPS